MAILWCNQLVKQLAAALVNIRDPAMSVHDRMDVFNQHLLETKSSNLMTHGCKCIIPYICIYSLIIGYSLFNTTACSSNGYDRKQ
jgi:hypothetical protein